MSPVLRRNQLFAWLLFTLFIAGFLVAPIGLFTGPILGVWFAGTQTPRRGFAGMLLLSIIPSVLGHARTVFAPHAAIVLACLFVAAILSVLPFLVHRLLSPHLPGILSTLPFPIAHSTLLLFTASFLHSHPVAFLDPKAAALFPVGLTFAAGVPIFFVDWFAAALVHGWNLEFRRAAWTFGRPAPPSAPDSADLPLFRSPVTSQPLHFDQRRTALVSASGERFPIRAGITNFLRPQDLTGLNRKYNSLYQIIGGFYDDSQRVVFALAGIDRDAYVHGYLDLLEVKSGDTVLETSIGTGLNFKYLPSDVSRFGLDLSSAMLAACRQNFRRWRMDARLCVGNAEALPFADCAFDCVFHVGGINFFSDRQAGIREMIRVAKPGSILLIADETEEHVKSSFETFPVTGEYFKNRTDAVAAPIDMIPTDMLDIRLQTLRIRGKNRFYALTFRKPLAVQQRGQSADEAAALEPEHV